MLNIRSRIFFQQILYRKATIRLGLHENSELQCVGFFKKTPFIFFFFLNKHIYLRLLPLTDHERKQQLPHYQYGKLIVPCNVKPVVGLENNL